jgi:hypothetical protein
MWGAWGIYALLPSERILISDRISGFFLFSFNRELFTQVLPSDEIRLFPNPGNTTAACTVQVPYDTKATKIFIFDSFGRKIAEKEVKETNLVTLDATTVGGVYYVQIELLNNFNETEIHIKKLIIQ